MENIWDIATQAEFSSAALATFRRQSQLCEPYRRYLELIGCQAERVERVEQIPFLPIELFKSSKVYCGDTPPEVVFTSSGEVSSRHYMSSLATYEEAFTRGFAEAYGAVEGWGIYALLPSYLEREGSSLIYMFERLIAQARAGGFYLYDHAKLMADMACDKGPKILLGVSYALLDLAESEVVTEPFGDVVVMETGGMKGRREELSKAELHARLCSAFGVSEIHSEYGMAELTSQGYSKGGGRFVSPNWMRVFVRDVADPFDVRSEGRGGVNIIDLASQDSCAFIQTQDMGRVYADGSYELEGRIAGSDIRGCNLLIE